MLKLKYKLEGLCCAGCAAKIENGIRDFLGTECTADVGSKTLTVFCSHTLSKDEENEITKVVTAIDPDINVIKINENAVLSEDDKGFRTLEILKIILSSAFFVFALFPVFQSIKTVLFFISYIISGGVVILKAVKGLFGGKFFNEFFLMSIASAGAFILGEYAEGAAVMLFYSVGEFFQELSVMRSRKSIKALISVMPDYAVLKCDEGERRVPPSSVSAGDIIIIKPGDKIPLDGVVTEGASLVDTSALTGEAMPRRVMPGDEVLGGYINLDGLIFARVTKPYTDSAAYKILDLVENAVSRKAPTERFISKFSRYYTPLVVAASVLTAAAAPFIIRGLTFRDSIFSALVLLVISCPCALVISVPLGFFGGISAASRHGILVKGSSFLETLKDVDTVVFDKTGTLTCGSFSVTNISCYNGFDKEAVIKYAAYAESYSTHPIALSVTKAYSGDIDKTLISDYRETEGMGVSTVIGSDSVIIGNRKFMEEEGILFPAKSQPGTALYVSVNSLPAGIIIIADTIKPSASALISSLYELGISKLSMLTGDVSSTAYDVAKKLGIDTVYAELLPHEKADVLEKIKKSSKGRVAYMGDGINDAPVLALSDVGITMGDIASDATIDSADVVILGHDISKLADAIKIARKTSRIVKSNIAFALTVKLLILVLGIFGAASMWAAVFADVGVALLAVLNSMRILKIKL